MRRILYPPPQLSDYDYKCYISEAKRKKWSKHKHGENATFQYDLDHRNLPGWTPSFGILVLDSNLAKTCEDCGKKKPRFASKPCEFVNAASRLVSLANK